MPQYTIKIRTPLDKSLHQAWEASRSSGPFGQSFETYLSERLENEAAEFRLTKITEENETARTAKKSARTNSKIVRPGRLSRPMTAPTLDRMCAEYKLGTPVAVLAARFGRSEDGIYFLLRKRKVRMQWNRRERTA